MSSRSIGGGSAQTLPTGGSLRLIYATGTTAAPTQFKRAGAAYLVDSTLSFKILKIYYTIGTGAAFSLGFGTTNTTTMSNTIYSSLSFQDTIGFVMIPFEEQDFTTIPSSNMLSVHPDSSSTYSVFILGYVS